MFCAMIMNSLLMYWLAVPGGGSDIVFVWLNLWLLWLILSLFFLLYFCRVLRDL